MPLSKFHLLSVLFRKQSDPLNKDIVLFKFCKKYMQSEGERIKDDRIN